MCLKTQAEFSALAQAHCETSSKSLGPTSTQKYLEIYFRWHIIQLSVEHFSAL